ncbi:HAD-IC family P-type ATPase, partial [Bordetella petrii]|uniref:HAD-IC family P-type ATPase n=1 Tax=Bordetella petrii TaxID=94624 RepID=UPI001E3374AD
VAAARERGLAVEAAEDFQAITGAGVQARVGGRNILAGAARLMARHGVDLQVFGDRAAEWGQAGKTPVYVAVDGRPAAMIAVSDPLKPSAVAAIQALHALGVKTAMITGDNEHTARGVARQVGIDEVRAEVLPDGKVAAIDTLRQGGRRLAFVGDGINDAPALAAADIGIAIGTGTDVAIEAASVVLMADDLHGVPNAIGLSRATLANIRQNLFWAFAYNAALIPLAAGVLYPAFGLSLSPVFAAAAMALSSVFVLGNALRLRAYRPHIQEPAS